MVAAGLIIDLVFRVLGLVPEVRNASVIGASITLNYTTVLNIVFLILAAVLCGASSRPKGQRCSG
jgi:hypothetical protein